LRRYFISLLEKSGLKRIYGRFLGLITQQILNVAGTINQMRRQKLVQNFCTKILIKYKRILEWQSKL